MFISRKKELRNEKYKINCESKGYAGSVSAWIRIDFGFMDPDPDSH
jgi:hypothetical protein